MSGLDELDLIGWIEKLPVNKNTGLLVGVGDDCAVFKPDKGKVILTTTDTLAEGVHFDRMTADPRLLGAKTASVNLSDIASMGGEPKYALLSPCFPKGLKRKWIEEFFRGFHETVNRYGCSLIGGNISSSIGQISLTATILGQIAEKQIVKRDGATPGDSIYITGTPGDSTLGLDLLLAGRKPRTKDERYLVSRHMSPTPRVEWGRLIAENRLASSMIDVSDGVALDLMRILRASKASASVTLERLPLSGPARMALSRYGSPKKGWEKILKGGEDYELLFTVRPKNEGRVEKLIGSGKIIASRIGQVTEGSVSKIRFSDSSGHVLKLREYGYTHRL